MQDLVYFYPEGHQAHSQAGHPERPERVETIVRGLNEAGLWEPYPKVAPLPIPDPVMNAIHSPNHLDYLERASQLSRMIDADTYVTRASFDLALNAAGGTAAVALAVWSGEARRGFALSRPPGHHATTYQAMGFCLLNNIALAAQTLIQEGARRVAIVDLDLHHGNGTQEIFYERSDVFYFSTHQWPLYPGTGRIYDCGMGPGKGYTANLPLPPYSGDEAFQAAMDEWILPLLNRFQPEMILVSFGFDPHWRDPLGSLVLTAEKYGQLIASLANFADQACDGKLALVLEGGYDLEAAKACSQAAVCAMLGKNFKDPIGPGPIPEQPDWKDVLYKAKIHWEV